MAIAAVVSDKWEETGATTYTRAFDNTGGATDLLVVGVSLWTASSDWPDTITYDGVGLTVRRVDHGTTYKSAELWTLDSPAQGSNNLVIGTFSANRNMTWGATVLSGADNDTFGAVNSGSQSGGSYTTQAMTLTTTINNSWHVSMLNLGSLRASTMNSADSTLQWTIDNNTNGSCGSLFTDLKVTAGADTNTAGWTTATDETSWASLEVEEGAAPPPAVVVSANHFLLMGV